MVEYRRAQRGDVQAIREVGIASWWATYTGVLAPRVIAAVLRRGWSVSAVLDQVELVSSHVWVAQDNEEIVGVLFASSRHAGAGYSLIERLYVRADYHGRGVGYGLWRHFASELTSDIAAVELDVLVGNERAIQFYLRLGFQETHRFVDTIAGFPMPLIYMRKDRPFV